MTSFLDRRAFLLSATAAPALLALGTDVALAGPPRQVTPAVRFPHQDPALVKELVTVCHQELARVQPLVEARPALARATWDWGFGDWETALGAASHTGHRDIAEFLIGMGARATIFSAAMLGQLDVVRAFVAASPGIEATPGPHGITLLAHARAGGDEAAPTLAYLQELGTADPRIATVALTAEERQRYVGTFAYGSGADDRVEISENREMLRLVPAGDTARVLFHLGDDTFYPTGAPAVRISFEMAGGRAAAFTVVDGGTGLRAERVG